MCIKHDCLFAIFCDYTISQHMRSQRPDFGVQSAVNAAAVQLPLLSGLVSACVCA